MPRCDVCFRHCELSEGQTGACGARICSGGKVVPKSFGLLSAVALDPIEKKPLNNFFSGSRILSVGGYGCNLRCPFCQNWQISWSKEAMQFRGGTQLSPSELTALVQQYIPQGNIGIAFTYNEPLIHIEYIEQTAQLSHSKGLKNVLVTNGCADVGMLDRLNGLIDAMNIDLKSFNENTYKTKLGGDLETVMTFIEGAVRMCHVEITNLIVPGISDSEEEFDSMTDWIAQLGRDIPLHITRFFPRFKMQGANATDTALIRRFSEKAKQKLRYVYIGNC